MRALPVSRAAEFRATVDKVIAMLAERGLKVTQTGIGAYVRYSAEGEVELVNIPQIPEKAGEDFISAIRGFIDHEIGHVLETDGPGIMAAIQRNPKAHGLINVVEDVRIERAMQKRFGGSAQHINDLWEFMLDKQVLPLVQTSTSEAKDFSILLPSVVHAMAGKRAAQAFLDKHNLWPRCEKIVQVLEPFRAGLEAGTLKSTDDAVALAERMFEEFERAQKKEEPPAPPPPAPAGKDDDKDDKDDSDEDGKGDPDEPGTGEADSEPCDDPGEQGDDDGAVPPPSPSSSSPSSDEQDGDDDADADTDGDQGDADESEGDDADADGDESEGSESADADSDHADGDDASQLEDDAVDEAPGEQDAGKEAGEGASDEDEDADEPDERKEGDAPQVLIDSTDFLAEVKDTEKLFEETANSAVVHKIDRSEYLVFTRDLDVTVEVTSTRPDLVAKEALAMDLETAKLTGQLSNQFRRLFAQQEYSVPVGGLRAGRLNAPALFRLSMNDDRVFFRREEHHATDTAVSLLVDCSGSMSGEPLQLALTSANAFSATLDRVGIANEVLGFTSWTGGEPGFTSELYEQMEEEQKRMGRRFSRFEPIRMYVFKGFNEPYRVARTRFAAARSAVIRHSNVKTWSNLDSESLEYAAIRLMPRREQRKVLIVFSDGQPAGGGVGPHLQRHLRDTVKRLEAARVETLGIGILDNSVSYYYPKHVVLNRLEDLPTTVMKELSRMLLK